MDRDRSDGAAQVGEQPNKKLVPPEVLRVREAVLHLLELAIAYEHRGTVHVVVLDSSTATSDELRPEDDLDSLKCLMTVVEALTKHLCRQHEQVRRPWLRKMVDALTPVYDATVSLGPLDREAIRSTPDKPITAAEGAHEHVERALQSAGFCTTKEAKRKATPRAGFVKPWDGAKNAAETVAGVFAGLSPRSIHDRTQEVTQRMLLRTQFNQMVTEDALVPYVEDLVREASEKRAAIGTQPTAEDLGPFRFDLLPCADNASMAQLAGTLRQMLRVALLGEQLPGDPRETSPNMPEEERTRRIMQLESWIAEGAKNSQDPEWRKHAEAMIDAIVARQFPGIASEDSSR